MPDEPTLSAGPDPRPGVPAAATAAPSRSAPRRLLPVAVLVVVVLLIALGALALGRFSVPLEQVCRILAGRLVGLDPTWTVVRTISYDDEGTPRRVLATSFS
jgi:iron complex transport system permease protein